MTLGILIFRYQNEGELIGIFIIALAIGLFRYSRRRRIEKEESRSYRRTKATKSGNHPSDKHDDYSSQNRRSGESNCDPSTNISAELAECYKILEVPYSASQTEVARAYKELVLVWHPDRFVDVNLKKKAEEKTKTINGAYEKVRKHISDHPSEPFAGGTANDKTASQTAAEQPTRNRIVSKVKAKYRFWKTRQARANRTRQISIGRRWLASSLLPSLVCGVVGTIAMYGWNIVATFRAVEENFEEVVFILVTIFGVSFVGFGVVIGFVMILTRALERRREK